MITIVEGPSALLARARDEADRLSAAAGVEIRMLDSPLEMAAASALLARVWHVTADRAHVDPGLLVAMAHTHNYVSGAFRGGVLVAVSMGFFHPPADLALHSHITGVEEGLGGSGIGKAIKFHQRAWALSRGAETITWTYDPLIARNAYFNLHRLGTRAVRYLPDFYGSMTDGINAGQGSDRMLVAWDLVDAAPGAGDHVTVDAVALSAAEDRPVRLAIPGGATVVAVEIPSDTESLRRRDPRAAGEWRLALRSALTDLTADGWSIIGFQRNGSYILERSTP